MTTHLTFDPVDVLTLRGNRAFGGAVHGEGVMPPWPSAFAGALASRALADAGRVDEVTRHPDRAEAVLEEVLGADHGITTLGLAKGDDAFFPLQADLVGLEGPRCARIEPEPPSPDLGGVAASALLPWLPVLAAKRREKPVGGLWIRADGLAGHLSGALPEDESLVPARELWRLDPRLGIALDPSSRTAAEGQLYTTDAVALVEGVRFVACFAGQDLPRDGLVRLGGDGRGARLEPASKVLSAKLERLGRPGAGGTGFRMLLATPGLFPDGWLPPGVGPDRILRFDGLVAELVAAAVPRHEVVSGWDLANHAPKPARKIAPAGSVYWFRVLEGDTAALSPLREQGLWPLLPAAARDPARRREGFNHVWFGHWQPKEV